MKADLHGSDSCLHPGGTAWDALPQPTGCRGDAATALAQSGAASSRPRRPANKAEFLQAAAVLAAASTGSYRLAKLHDDLWTALVSCPYEKWHETFGEPECVTEHYDASLSLPIQTWQYQCSDGPVTCVGHLLQRPKGRWVVLARVCLFPSRS